MTRKVYDPKQLSVVFGITPIVGFAEDTMISIESESPKYNSNHDIHGNVTRYRVNKRVAKITVTLVQSSKSNDLLSNYAELDEVSNGGVFTIMIKDPHGTTLFSCPEAWIIEPPKLEFGTEGKNREWVIEANNFSQYIGS
jgi:hypothetical protein